MLANTKANEMVNKYEVSYHLNDFGLDESNILLKNIRVNESFRVSHFHPRM